MPTHIVARLETKAKVTLTLERLVGIVMITATLVRLQAKTKTTHTTLQLIRLVLEHTVILMTGRFVDLDLMLRMETRLLCLSLEQQHQELGITLTLSQDGLEESAIITSTNLALVALAQTIPTVLPLAILVLTITILSLAQPAALVAERLTRTA
jgi:hypothetical protein